MKVKNKKQKIKKTKKSYEAESTVDDLSPAHAAAIVEAHPRGAPERVTCKDDFLSPTFSWICYAA
jgi:hypothetical protein